jgi:transposase
VDRLPNDLPKLRRYLQRLGARGPLAVCYEASGAGFVLHRAVTAWGHPCAVIAPSLIPTKPGVQRKHDRYDAAQLVRLFPHSRTPVPENACESLTPDP